MPLLYTPWASDRVIKADVSGYRNFTKHWARILFQSGKLHLAIA